LIRTFAKAAPLLALGALAIASLAAPAQAQDTLAAAPPPAASTGPAVNPRGPIPYTALRPKPPAKPRPAASTTSATATGTTATTPGAKPAAATLTTAAPAAPAAPSGARLNAGQALPPAELEAFVDGVVKDAMDREHIAGVTVSIVQNGQVVLKKGYGFASLTPARRVDPDKTLFRIGSISKTFTWIALMKEVEAGRIRLDAPINLYLPEQLWVRDQGFRAPVRVINLMDHSAGFEDRALGHLFEKTFDRERPLADYLRQERPRRIHAPGVMSSYSNYGAALAGEAVTYVSGKPFERLIEDEILRPTGMGHTTFREQHPDKAGLPGPMPAALVPDISEGYRWTSAGFKPRPYEYIGHVAPAGAASSTAGDMARYMQLLLDNGTLDGATVFGARSAQAFRTSIRRTPPGINGWSHGFIEYALPGDLRGYGHAGGTLSFLSNMVVVPDLKLGVFISTNTETGHALADRFASRVVSQFYATPQPYPRAGSPALADEAQIFEGYYVGSRRAYGGLEKLVGLLRSGARVDVTPEGRLVTTSERGVETWAPVGDPAEGRFISATGSEHLAFRLADGHAWGFQTAFGDQTYERAGFWNQPGVLAVMAGLTLVAAAATLGGILVRNRREFRETPIQGRASLLQNTQAVLWLACGLLFLTWASKVGDVANIMYGWPGASLVIASACALVAAVLTLFTLITLPAIWRGGRRVDSWTALRKAAFSVTVLVYTAFSVLLGLWGGLSPWGG
jgi:CubicO group peptidase (beta-lactamase class C family)